MFKLRKVEITKKQYEILCNADAETRYDTECEIAENSFFPPCAYGMYSNGTPVKEKDKYYMEWYTDSTCD